MTEAEIALAREAVACKGWKWMSGMLAYVKRTRTRWTYHVDPKIFDGAVPVLADDATKGALLCLVRKAWELPYLFVRPVYSIETGEVVGWTVTLETTAGWFGATEEAALVAALKAAP